MPANRLHATTVCWIPMIDPLSPHALYKYLLALLSPLFLLSLNTERQMRADQARSTLLPRFLLLRLKQWKKGENKYMPYSLERREYNYSTIQIRRLISGQRCIMVHGSLAGPGAYQRQPDADKHTMIASPIFEVFFSWRRHVKVFLVYLRGICWPHGEMKVKRRMWRWERITNCQYVNCIRDVSYVLQQGWDYERSSSSIITWH